MTEVLKRRAVIANMMFREGKITSTEHDEIIKQITREYLDK